METVLVTGGTGLVGSHLVKRLLEKEYKVLILTRGTKKSTQPNLGFIRWDLDTNFLEQKQLGTVNHVIHLAGTNVAEKKWSTNQKKMILDSRVKSTQLLFDYFSLHSSQLKTFISASGVGAYGYSDSDILFDETSPYGTNFLAKVCQQWEKSVFQFNDLGMRTVVLRTGVVFAKQDSALQKIVKPIKMFVGAPIGSGEQQTPFIHIDDLVGMYINAIENTAFNGVYNAIVDNITNTELTKIIAKKLKRPLFFPNIPAFVMRAIFGEMSIILLKGNRISNQKMMDSGFKFQYDSVDSVLESLL